MEVLTNKTFTMLKIIDKDAHEQLLFVGAKKPEETGAAGCLDTLEMDFSILQEVLSIVTDGTKMNSGERGGLSVLLEKLRQQQILKKESLVP